MQENSYYCRTLNYGGAAIERCMYILDFWTPGMDSNDLFTRILEEGRDSSITASSLKHSVKEVFKSRFLTKQALPWTEMLFATRQHLSSAVIEQICFLLTCRCEGMLSDFLSMEYWPRVVRGEKQISKDTLHAFLSIATSEGRGGGCWTESRFRRALSSLSAACNGFHLVKREQQSLKLTPPMILNEVVLCLAYDLKSQGLVGDELISHEDWTLFGLTPTNVRKRLNDRSFLPFFKITESLSATFFSWNIPNMMDAMKHYVTR